MISIIGIDGLKPTLNLIKLSKNIAIVNKEALICGWSLIKKKLSYYKTNFIPIDSEHFSLNILLKDKIYKNIKNIYITASGGPFLNNKKFYKKNISVKDAINHPNWKMGKKISIDSSTMMNKVFEVIEAKNIFNLPYNKIKIIIHPKSYIHAIVEYNNGIINFLAHTPDMKIPIFNSIVNNNFVFRSNNLNFKILNNLNFQKIDKKQFPLIRILDNMPKFNSLFETSLVIINDFFVNLFLEKKITYQSMIKHIEKFIFSIDISKNKRIYVKNINQIISFHKYLSLKLNKYVYKS
jgi:1-deoxy-D-xylulose-5-phosphate reductoisomerase